MTTTEISFVAGDIEVLQRAYDMEIRHMEIIREMSKVVSVPIILECQLCNKSLNNKKPKTFGILKESSKHIIACSDCVRKADAVTRGISKQQAIKKY